jgi:hypothetical protein
MSVMSELTAGGVILPTREAIAGLRWPIGGLELAVTKGASSALALAIFIWM